MIRRRIGYGIAMTLRVFAICVLGWFLAFGIAGLSGIALHTVGVSLADAMLATSLLSYIFYIAIVMWGFADRTSILRPLAVLGLTVLTIVTAGMLSPGILDA